MERVVFLLQQRQIPGKETHAVARRHDDHISAQTHIQNDICELEGANLV